MVGVTMKSAPLLGTQLSHDLQQGVAGLFEVGTLGPVPKSTIIKDGLNGVFISLSWCVIMANLVLIYYMNSLKTIETIIKLFRPNSFKIQLRVTKFCDALAQQPVVRLPPNMVW